jgi:hypothetical protein
MATTKKSSRGLGSKTKCSVAGSQLASSKTKSTKASAGAKLGSKACKKK